MGSDHAPARGSARHGLVNAVTDGYHGSCRKGGSRCLPPAGAEPPPQASLRVAWLELAPSVPAWGRSGEQDVVSHRSAAMVFGLGDQPADVHEFTPPVRRQTRLDDVRLHRGDVAFGVVSRGGLLTTDPSRTAVDLLLTVLIRRRCQRSWQSRWTRDTTDPPHLPTGFRPWRTRYRFSRHDGVGMLGWLLDLAGAADRDWWIAEASDGGAGLVSEIPDRYPDQGGQTTLRVPTGHELLPHVPAKMRALPPPA